MTRLIFDKYEIIRRLAIGGMGEIFLARQHGVAGFDRLVILKSLLPELAESQDAVNQFLDEARVAATLNHPNIVSIYEVGSWDGIYFIAMEYIEGENVSVLIKTVRELRQHIPWVVCARVIHDAAIGLDHAHNARDTHGQPLMVVHRDVSPQNIMVRGDGVTKVVDFGVAKAANRSTRTATGVLKGKIRYMPPEQITGGKLDGRSDQFSLGVVLWEMLAMQRLFHKSENDADTMRRMLHERIPLPSAVAANVPPELDAVAARMLSRDPAGRYARCRDVAGDLRRYLEQATPDLGDAQVAELIQRMLGERIKDRTSDLTPSHENFFISLAPTESGVKTKTEEATDVGPTRPVRLASGSRSVPAVAPPPPQAARRGLWIALGAVLLALAGGLAYAVLRPETEVVQAVVGAREVPVETGAIEVLEPKGSRILVDGAAWASPAPATVAGLVPGEHELRLELAGHAPIVKKLTLRAGETATVREFATAIPPVLALGSEPAGATVRAGSLILGTTPLELGTLSHGTKHELRVEKPGFETRSVFVELAPGERRELAVTLERSPAKPRRTSSEARAERRAASPEVAAAPVERDGYLTLKTTPWTKVTIEGRPYGATPVFKLRLAPGKHELRLTNEQANVDHTRSVTIRAGETTKLDLSL